MTPRCFAVARYSAHVWCAKSACFWHVIARGMANTKPENAHTFQAQKCTDWCVECTDWCVECCFFHIVPCKECHIHTDFSAQEIESLAHVVLERRVQAGFPLRTSNSRNCKPRVMCNGMAVLDCNGLHVGGISGSRSSRGHFVHLLQQETPALPPIDKVQGLELAFWNSCCVIV